MKTRVITAIIALALFVGILLLPPIVFTIALAAVILVMLYECYTATKADTAMQVVGFISAIIVMTAMWAYTHFYMITLITTLSVSVILLLNMAIVVFKHGKRSYKDILSNACLTVYITFSMFSIFLTKHYYGTALMLTVFVCAWSCDTFAYFAGKLFGKRKLIPHVSPNKTIAGAVGGVVGAGIGCAILFVIKSRIGVPAYTIGHNDWIVYAFIGGVTGIIGGVLSQMGDLIASSIKRDEDIKDFGWIFPGHGGFMDRFDSVMYIAPIIMVINSITNLIFALQPYLNVMEK